MNAILAGLYSLSSCPPFINVHSVRCRTPWINRRPVSPNTSWACEWIQGAVHFNASTKTFDSLPGVDTVDFGGWDGLVYGAPLKQAYEEHGYAFERAGSK